VKLWIFSDLHIEQSEWDLPEPQPDCDVIVAAGDIHFASDAVWWLNERSQGRPVVYVPGNHEWYSYSRPFSVETERAAAEREAKETNVNILLDEQIVIDRVRFLGSSLWTDYALYGDVGTAMSRAKSSLNDHRLIVPQDGAAALTPEDALAWHRASRAFLERKLPERSPDFDRTVVVTHHLPHPRSVHPRYGDDPLNAAFASDLSELVEHGGADLWIHGHTHSSCDYVAGGTRVVCNPKGYGPRGPGRIIENGAFDEALLIEV
jgi:predicted phosphodiesterase